MGKNQPLKALNDNWYQGDWTIVIEIPDFLFLGHRDNGGGFEASGDYSLLQGQVEYIGITHLLVS